MVRLPTLASLLMSLVMSSSATPAPLAKEIDVNGVRGPRLRGAHRLRPQSVFGPSRLGSHQRGGRKAISVHRLHPALFRDRAMAR
jgi:hypothetical protein